MDSALIQTLAAGTIVLGAAVFLGRRALRTVAASRRSAKGATCGDGGCGCGEVSGASSETQSLNPPARR